MVGEDCTPYSKDSAVLEQRRRVKIACFVEAACGSPSPARRIVEFRASELVGERACVTSCDEHLAAEQQGRRVIIASFGEAAGAPPGPTRQGVVEAGSVAVQRIKTRSRIVTAPVVRLESASSSSAVFWFG